MVIDEPEAGSSEEKIIEAAHTVFLRRGTHGARMQEIAEEAGVNKALLHYYFRSKDKLAKAVFKEAFSTLVPRLAQTLTSEAPIEEKVETVIHYYLDFMTANPYVPGYLIAEVNHCPERTKQVLASLRPDDVGYGKLADQLEERIEAGTLRPISVEQFVANLFSLCVFPFAGRPMMETMLDMDDAAFDAFIEERKQTLPAFFMHALKPC